MAGGGGNFSVRNVVMNGAFSMTNACGIFSLLDDDPQNFGANQPWYMI